MSIGASSGAWRFWTCSWSRPRSTGTAGPSTKRLSTSSPLRTHKLHRPPNSTHSLGCRFINKIRQLNASLQSGGAGSGGGDGRADGRDAPSLSYTQVLLSLARNTLAYILISFLANAALVLAYCKIIPGVALVGAGCDGWCGQPARIILTSHMMPDPNDSSHHRSLSSSTCPSPGPPTTCSAPRPPPLPSPSSPTSSVRLNPNGDALESKIARPRC